MLILSVHTQMINSQSIANKSCFNLTYRVLSSETNVVTINFTAITTDVNVYYKPINASLSLSLLPIPIWI